MELTDVVRSLEDHRDHQRERAVATALPTGSLGLDLALGGGWCRGQISELAGDYSTYKTTFALHSAAQAQKFGPVLWLDSASDFNPARARKAGVNAKKLAVFYPESIDRAMYTMRIAAQDYALMVVDTASGLDIDEGYTDHEFMFDRWFSWLKTDIQPLTAVLFITNAYATADQLFTRVLRKWAPQVVMLKPGSRNDRVTAEVRPGSRVPPSFHANNWRFTDGVSFDAEYELIQLGQHTGVITQMGSWYYFFNRTMDRELSAFGNGVQQAADFLRGNPGIAAELREAIKARVTY